MVQHFLKCDQIIDQDLFSRFKGNRVCHIFCLSDHCLEQTAAVTLSNDQRDEQTASDYKDRNCQK